METEKTESAAFLRAKEVIDEISTLNTEEIPSPAILNELALIAGKLNAFETFQLIRYAARKETGTT
jgi:uncharacterized protein YydD (DUF2326 family)